MYKKLVALDGWRFAEVDPVRLKRTAITLRDQILSKIDRSSDKYGFYTETMPFLDAAIRGEIAKSIDENRTKFIPGNFLYDKAEGCLPLELDRAFTAAVADFRVTVKGMPLEETQEIVRDGMTFAWVEFEDRGIGLIT